MLLATVVARYGEYDAADTLNAEALALYRALGDRPRAAAVLNNMGSHAFLAGNYERAQELLEESLRLCRDLDDGYTLIYPLVTLGQTLLERGEFTRARALLSEGLQAAQQRGIKDMLPDYLEEFAWLAAVQGAAEQRTEEHTRRSARLFGSAEAQREAIGARLVGAELAFHARHIATVRAQLDEATWQAAWAEGRAMTLEQAIAYALEETKDG